MTLTPRREPKPARPAERTTEKRGAAEFCRDVELLRALIFDDYERLAAGLVPRKPGPNEFLRFIDRHGLRFYVARKLKNARLRSLFDDRTLQHLDEHLRINRIVQAGLVAELLRLTDLLSNRGMEYRLLKGPGLACRFFGGIDGRNYADLDILVRREELAEACQFLKDEGYRRESGNLLGDRIATRFAHGYDYSRGRFRIDLHWTTATHFSYRIDESAFWRESVVVPIAGKPIFVLPDESSLRGHAVSFFEDIERGVGRLKTVVDLEAILFKIGDDVDWTAFFARSQEEGVEGICRVVLGLSLDLLDARKRFPTLQASLAEEDGSPPLDWGQGRDLLESTRGRLRNKFWASRFYACSRASALGWWVLSLPFRIAVYDPKTLSRSLGLRSVSH